MEDVRDVVSLSLDKSLGGEGEVSRGDGGRTLRILLLRRRSRCLLLLLLLLLLRGFRAVELGVSWLVVVWRGNCTAV